MIAIKSRRSTEAIIFHSDKGNTFKSQEFGKLYKIIPSCSKPDYSTVTEFF